MLEGLEGWQLLCLAGALWAGIVVVRELIDRRLERAQERLQGPQVARVYLNGIEIGSLPVAQHKAMLARARRDFGLYLSQAINTVLLGGRMLLALFVFVPVVWLAALTLCLLVEPVEAGTIVKELLAILQQESAEKVGLFVQGVLQASLFLAAFLVGVSYFMSHGRLYGYRDVFKEAVHYQLRQELEAPAHGVVSVLYWGVDPQGDEPRVHQA
ncbi:TPA: hypothetical protein PKO72_004446 [Aeromonas hydrophila]|uniref:hypothetical protein n=1 Tax=Aeromonas TaxID=642 RepID=UPI001CCD4CEC|nr:hypothetical protein [Aeromonas hydrophila]UBQ52776.1 hypothetical protein LCH17_22300 [Aeromonas hydrophila]HDI1215647.1 hypothetical protein [Aeromonas hydrophila]HDO1376797.1 hypothetical protein [Aeromonas veronii]